MARPHIGKIVPTWQYALVAVGAAQFAEPSCSAFVAASTALGVRIVGTVH